MGATALQGEGDVLATGGVASVAGGRGLQTGGLELDQQQLSLETENQRQQQQQQQQQLARVSWWNTTHEQNAQHWQKTADAMLVDETGTLYPLSSRVDCAAPPPSPAATCVAQLAKDGCDPEQGPKACGTCAQLHRADLDRAGCSAANVTDYCEGKLPPALHR